MTQQHTADGEDVFARRYEYDNETVIAADLGIGGDASVDVVDGTAIVVIETPEHTRQESSTFPARARKRLSETASLPSR